MHITVKNNYDLQYLTMGLSGYTNVPTEPACLSLKNVMEYLMHHAHEPIMYSKKRINKTDKIPHQRYTKAGYAEISKNKEYYNSLHTYCDEYRARDISDRRSFISKVHLFNGTIIDWCVKKNSETSRSSSNAETIAMYKGVLYQNWIRDFFISIGYSIGPP